MNKVIIIGSGPAGATAAIYAARAGLSPLMIRGWQPGGQLTTTDEVENYPGFPHIAGTSLVFSMEEQAKLYGTNIIEGNVENVARLENGFVLRLDDGSNYESETIIAATGATAKYLGIESEELFKGFGISACATCDGFFYRNKKVMVVGGGNTAVEEALYLSNICEEVTLVHRRDSLRSEKILEDRLFNKNNIKILWNTEIVEFIGSTEPVPSLSSVKTRSGDAEEIRAIDGVFIAIGHEPKTGYANDFGIQDEEGYIKVKPGTATTDIPGFFAAGDVSDKVYRQAVTAAGMGCMAALEAEKYLNTKLSNIEN